MRISFLSAVQKQTFVALIAASCAAILMLALVALIGFITSKGLIHFWPMSVYTAKYQTIDSNEPPVAIQHILTTQSEQALLTKLNGESIQEITSLTDAINPSKVAPIWSLSREIELYQIIENNGRVRTGHFLRMMTPRNQYQDLDKLSIAKDNVDLLSKSLNTIQYNQLTPLHRKMANLDSKDVVDDAPYRLKYEQEFTGWQTRASLIEQQMAEYQIWFTDEKNLTFSIPLSDLDRLYQPNNMSFFDKLHYAVDHLTTFLSDNPKQAATTGGVFPAIFGTVLMVLLMTVIVTPFGALAAIYLNEYAPDNYITSMIRVCVSNMAGVPSVVYGVFGLGFFVYTMGGSIDALFYADALPTPTFGTPGLIWASLTMALLTLPVVIVSTEEGLRRVPSGLRAGSYALGATKIETIWNTVLPIASPGIMTGIILAIARAAGEVAPLILVGAVKFAPALPFDSEFPYLHLERQFMHLGVFIYDGAFHSQTSAQGESMMFASCMLLLLIVFTLNLGATIVRSKLRKRYIQG